MIVLPDAGKTFDDKCLYTIPALDVGSELVKTMLADALYKIVEHVLLETFESVIVDVLFIRTASSSQQRGEKKKKTKNQTLLFVEINEN